MKWVGIFISLAIFCLSVLQGTELGYASIFSDNMVLQQKTEVTIWGNGIPGSTVAVTGSWGVKSSSVCNRDSSWSTTLKTPQAGGPYNITINDGKSQLTLNNVLVGEVWLCSGQSNMEMPLEGWRPNAPIRNSDTEIRQANYPEIRLFTVERHVSTRPENSSKGEWLECSPATAAKFSATAYFFGRKLYKELNIPIGLIHSSWGGTPAESWTSKSCLSKIDDFKETLKKIDDSAPAVMALNGWLAKFPEICLKNTNGESVWSDLDFNDGACKDIDFDDSKWKLMDLPTLWEETEVQKFDGAIWFRKKVTIPDNWLNKELQLRLGPIDDFDRSYVNGNLVGAIEEEGFWQTNRIYDVPAEDNNQKIITLAVRVNDYLGGGGIYGNKDELNLVLKETGESISIAGEWKYLPVAEYRGSVYTVFGTDPDVFTSRPVFSIEISAYTATTLFNGMIAPLIPYRIKGAIWYQGEANVENPVQYEILFPTMIKCWRNNWGYDFPFYFVQIAPYDYGSENHSEYLRDAQRKTLSVVKNTGMAVTMDIATVDNIHPPNKQDVGARLAYWALAKLYSKDIMYSGPLYKGQKIDRKKIIISFDYADGLTITDDVPNEFMIAGSDQVFYPAKVKIKNDQLIVYSKNVKKPVAVRYAWSNTSGASLFNAAGLPASSFRTDSW